MSSVRPSRKRAGTSTFALPSVSALRQKRISPEQYQQPPEPQPRNEFPFPIMPIPSSPPSIAAPLNKHLELSTPDEDFEAVDITYPQVPQSITSYPLTFEPTRPGPSTLPTPPRSHPTNPTSFTHSPLSASYTLNSTGLYPSPCTLPSPHAAPIPNSTSTPPLAPPPTTPLTGYQSSLPLSPTSIFTSAARSLKTILMADELGMSVQEIEEISNFALLQGSSKRAGRVLVQKSVRQRKPAKEKSVKLKHGVPQVTREQQREVTDASDARSLEVNNGEDKGNVSGGWREVNWIAFSDSDSDSDPTTNVDPDVHMDLSGVSDCDTLCDGISPLNTTMNSADEDERSRCADMERDGNDRDMAQSTILGVANIARKTRPVKISSRAVGSLERKTRQMRNTPPECNVSAWIERCSGSS